MARECIVDDVIGGHAVARGTMILISIYGIHRSELWWPLPDVFDPERFAVGREWSKNAFLPFGMGKHISIGAAFALTEMKIILSMVMQRYRFELERKVAIGEIARIMPAPSCEIPLRLTPRT